MEEYHLAINNFEGPMDILLDLIKSKKVDIFTIDLSELATEYLKLIAKLKVNNITLAGEYLVMASSLLNLKSKMLLAHPERKAELEVDKMRLLNQLAEYQQFKNISGLLRTKELERREIFSPPLVDQAPFLKSPDVTNLTGSSSVVQMMISLRKMFERTNAAQLRQTTIEAFNLSPKERMKEIKALFKTKSSLEFAEVFNVPTLKHFAVTMLALLDMARLQVVQLQQTDQFGVIKIKRGKMYGTHNANY